MRERLLEFVIEKNDLFASTFFFCFAFNIPCFGEYSLTGTDFAGREIFPLLQIAPRGSTAAAVDEDNTFFFFTKTLNLHF